MWAAVGIRTKRKIKFFHFMRKIRFHNHITEMILKFNWYFNVLVRTNI